MRLQYDDAGEAVEGVCVNISIGGMFVQVERPCREGGLVRFDLGVDEETSIRGLGESIWQEPLETAAEPSTGIGIKFRFLEPDDRQKVLKLVSHHIKQRLLARHPEFDLERKGDRLSEARARIREPEPPPAAAEEHAEEHAVPPQPAAGPAPDASPPTGEAEIVRQPPPPPPAPRARSPWRPPERERAQEKRVPGTPVVRVAPEPQQAATRPLEPEAAPPPAEETRPSAAEPRADPPPAFAPAPAAEEAEPTPDGELLPSLDEPLLEGEAEEGELRVAEDWLHPEGGAPAHMVGRAARRRRRGPSPLLWVALALAVLLLAWLLWGKRYWPGAEGGGLGAASSPAESPAESTPAEQPAAAAPVEPAVEGREVAPPSAPEPRPDSAAAPFRRVVDLRWRQQGEVGELLVRTDGAVSEGRFNHFRLDLGGVREVVRLSGVAEPYRGEVAVAGPLVAAIRTGLHQRGGDSELHVVLDLLDSRARILSVEPKGEELVVRLGRP